MVVLIAVLFWSPAGAMADSLTPVSVHLKWLHQFQSAGYIVALEKGYFHEAGLDVRLIEGGPGKTPVAAMLAGEADFAVADAGALLYRAEGKPVVVLASIFQHSPQVLYTREDIRRLQDLRGRRVMMQDGFLTIEVLSMLKAAGLEEADVVRQPIGHIEDLTEGRTDAFPGYSVNEGFLLSRQGIPYRMFRPRDFGIDFYGDTLLTSQRLVDEKPAIVAAFRRASILGWRYAIEHIDETAALIEAKYNTQHKSFDHLRYEGQAIKELMATDLVPIGLSNPERWQHIADTFSAQGYAMQGVDWDRFLYRKKFDLWSFADAHPLTLTAAATGALLLLVGIYALLLRRMVRRRTRELQAAYAEFKNILDNLQEVYFRSDRHGRLERVSRAIERVFGVTAETLIGRPMTSFHHEADGREKLLKALDHNGGRVSNYETVVRRPDGVTLHVMLNAQYWYDKHGNVMGTEGTIRDIGDIKAAEHERNLLNEQLLQAQKMESIGVLAGGIAHDFNNLLVSVMGNAELVMLDLPEEHVASQGLHGIFRAAQRGSDLVRQMLAYAGKGQVGVGRQNMDSIVGEMSDLMASAVGHHVQLNVTLAGDLPDVRGDRNQLAQVVMNLITNAAEALQGHSGVVTLSTGHRYLSEIPAGACLAVEADEGRYIFLRVEDNGCGMDQATRQRIFDPFFTTKEQGTGLGLAALLGIVRSHLGILTLDTAPGRGSAFTIYLPALSGSAVAEPGVDEFELAGHVSGLVLLVDDEDPVRRVARRMLEREGITVLEACDGEEAVQIFSQCADIDLVLLDLTMPKMGGEACFQAMRAIRPGVPVLLLSGHDSAEVAEHLHMSGLAGFIRKPYTRQALLSEVVLRLETS